MLGAPENEHLLHSITTISQVCFYLFLFVVLFLLPGLICACASGTLRRFGINGNSRMSKALRAFKHKREATSRAEGGNGQEAKTVLADAGEPTNEAEALRPKSKDATLNGWLQAIFSTVIGVFALVATACLLVYLLEVVTPISPLTEARALVIFEDFDLTPTALDMRDTCIDAGLPARPTAQAAVDGVNALEDSLESFGLEAASRPY